MGEMGHPEEPMAGEVAVDEEAQRDHEEPEDAAQAQQARALAALGHVTRVGEDVGQDQVRQGPVAGEVGALGGVERRGRRLLSCGVDGGFHTHTTPVLRVNFG